MTTQRLTNVVDRSLIGLVVASASILALCAWMIVAHPAPFHLRTPDGRLFRGLLYWILLMAPLVGSGASFVLSLRRQWWWTLIALLIGVFAGATFVLGSLWLGGGFRT